MTIQEEIKFMNMGMMLSMNLDISQNSEDWIYDMAVLDYLDHALLYHLVKKGTLK